MPKTSIFSPEQFIPTKFSTAADKARFANHLIRFIRKGFPKSIFPNWFYTRLSMTFGHIAHFNAYGFFDTFFTSEEGKRRFMQITLNHSCSGDPAWTYSDVEEAVQKYLREIGI